MKVEILRCWKTKYGICGEYYVTATTGEKELVIQNCNDIRVIAHWLEKKVEDCIMRPTSKVVEAVTMATVEYLKNQ